MKKNAKKEKHAGPRRPFPARLLLCILLGAAILANMVLIFCFSSENRETSGDRSHAVTRAVVKVLVKDYEMLAPEEQKALIQTYHPPVRKLAHFCEFGLLGVLTAAFMLALHKGRPWLWWIIPAGFCLLYAVSDEVHQMFTERGPAVTDVLIDFSGSLTGIIGIHLICLLVLCILKKRKAKL